jgi:hypothetical protein
MTTRDLSRTVMAAFAALTDRTAAAGGGAMPAGRHLRSSVSPARPAMAVLSPGTGSTGGSAAQDRHRQPSAVVWSTAMSAFVLDSRTIYACAPPHTPARPTWPS